MKCALSTLLRSCHLLSEMISKTILVVTTAQLQTAYEHRSRNRFLWSCGFWGHKGWQSKKEFIAAPRTYLPSVFVIHISTIICYYAITLRKIKIIFHATSYVSEVLKSAPRGWIELSWVRIFVCGAELAVQSQRRRTMVHACWKSRRLKVLSGCSQGFLRRSWG